MKKIYVDRYMSIVLMVLFYMFFFSCVSTKDSSDTLLNNEKISVYNAVNFSFKFQYPNKWHIFETEEEIKISNVLELLTFPPDEIKESMIRGSFLASLSMSSFEEIVTMHSEFSSMILKIVKNSSNAGIYLSDKKQKSIFFPNFIIINDKYMEQLVITKDVLNNLFDILLNDTMQINYIKEYATIMIKVDTKTTIFFRKMNDNMDNEYVVIYNVTAYDEINEQRVLEDSIQLISSISVNEFIK